MNKQRLINFICYVILLSVLTAANPLFGGEMATCAEPLCFNELALERPSNNVRTPTVFESKEKKDKGKVRNTVIIIFMSAIIVGMGVAFAIENK